MQRELAILGACAGLLSAVYFCIGTVTMSAEDIFALAQSKFDLNYELAASLTEQKAQHTTGAILLLTSFFFQTVAMLTPATGARVRWRPVAAVMACVLLSSLVTCSSIERYTHRQVQLLAPAKS